MFIKYQHARNGGLLATLVSAATGIALAGGDGEPHERSGLSQQEAVRQVNGEMERSRPAAVAPAVAERVGLVAGGDTGRKSPATQERAQTAAVVALAQQGSAGEAKRKDALGGSSPWKVNLYDDDRDGTWDRAKVDRDRDGTWDAKWSHKGGQWLNAAGLAWRGGQWTAPGAPPTPTRAAEGAAALKVVGEMAKPATGKKVKDLYRGSGPKVNLYDDDRDGTWDRAKVDVDRDGTWDEKLSRKGGRLERRVGSKVFVHRDGRWVLN